MRTFYILILILFLAAVGLFCYQNRESVGITFLGGSLTLPMPVLVLLIYVFGMISGWSVLSFLRYSWVQAVRTSS